MRKFIGYKIWLHLEAINENEDTYEDCLPPEEIAKFKGVKSLDEAERVFNGIVDRLAGEM
jgi:hypothetical protein